MCQLSDLAIEILEGGGARIVDDRTQLVVKSGRPEAITGVSTGQPLVRAVGNGPRQLVGPGSECTDLRHRDVPSLERRCSAYHAPFVFAPGRSNAILDRGSRVGVGPETIELLRTQFVEPLIESEIAGPMVRNGAVDQQLVDRSR